jgi:hypothetical protein
VAAWIAALSCSINFFCSVMTPRIRMLISSGVMLTKLFTGGGRDDDDDGWGVDISTGGS